MHTKRSLRIVRLMLGLSIALAQAGVACAADWRMASGFPDANYLTVNEREFLADVAKRTGGRVKVGLHNNQSLVKQPDTLRAVQTAQVELGEIYAANLGNQEPMFTLDAVPFLAPDEKTAALLWSVQKPYITNWFAKRDVRVLYAGFFPAQGFYAKKPVKAAADLEGLKLRIYSNETRRMAELLKAQPLVVQFGEVPQAFATGLINAMFTSPQTGIDTQAWDFTSHFVNVGAMRTKIIIVINEGAFGKLSKADQGALLAAAGEAEQRMLRRCSEVTSEQTEQLKAKGMNTSMASPQFLAELKKIGQVMTDEWSKRANPEQNKVLSAYQAKLKQ